MHPSKSGMVDEDKKLCDELLTITRPIDPDILFDDKHFKSFHANLRGRSESRISADIHPRLMPSAENLYIRGHEEFSGLREGHNDPWTKSIKFYGPRPQPDHTFGFKWSNFNEEQRAKLCIEPTQKSLYTAREDIYFPFLTGEIKCGKQGLDLADRPNAHSMACVLRGIVDLYRKTKHADDVHRRVLGFSISHDDNGARIYAHYPEIDGENTTYWRETLDDFTFGHNSGELRWKCYHFTLNVCTMFAMPFLQRLKKVIDELPTPGNEPFDLTTISDDTSIQNSQEDINNVGFQNESFRKPQSNRGVNAQLRNMIQTLQQQLEQQRQEMKEREAALQGQLEQQRQEMKEREVALQRQQSELVKMLDRQGAQLEQQSEQIRQLLAKK